MESKILKNKKQLIIIQNINREQLANFDTDNTDFLCIDIDCMLKLKMSELPFISFFDFYDAADFMANLKVKLSALKEIFKKLDSKYAPVVNYPRIFMGNYYIFLVYFADFFFISEVIARLQNKYLNITLYTCYTKEELKDFDNAKIDFFNPFSIIKNRDLLIARLLHEGLNSELVYSKPIKITKKSGKFDYYLSVLMKSNKRLFAGYFIWWLKNNFFIKLNMNKRIVFSVDMDYEPSYLRPFMVEYNLINPLKTIRKNKLNKYKLPDFLETESDLIEEIKDLTTLKDDTFLKILKIYQRDVISFIPSFINEMELKIKECKPLCVFFSIGQVNILENVVAFLSNKYKIPIFNFQHGDSLEFAKDILEFNRYIELNENVEKTLIVRSKKQYDLLNKIEPSNTKLFHGGSSKIFFFKNNFPNKKYWNSSKILVIAGPYPADAYKDGRTSDKEVFDKHNQMFRLFKKYHLNIDIKTFPNSRYLSYYEKMLQYYDLRKSKILVQPSVEFLLPNYDLIIMEYIGSALTPLLMTLKIPVVYWIEKKWINQNVYDDFCRRHYLISNEIEFESLIKQFTDNKLYPKYDEELIKTYCFPSSTIDPAKIIANHIKNLIKHA